MLFTEGQLVKAGAVLAQIDPAPFQVALEQAEGQLARDAATLTNARLDLDRYHTLLAQDSIATQLVDQQASMVKQLEGTVKIDQAQVDNAKLQLSYTHIAAPIAGRLGLRLVDAGNMVHGSDANGLAVITQVDPITVVFAIPQDTLPRVLERLRAGDKPAVEAWDREQKTLLARGVLLTADNQIDVTTGTVKLKAQFANADLRLFPNQFVNVRMVIDTVKGAVVVPTAAIQRGSQGTVVYVVGKDSTVSLRAVKTGPTEGAITAIDSGVQAGERVVTDGVDRIREGAKVEVTHPGGDGRGARPARGTPSPGTRRPGNSGRSARKARTRPRSEPVAHLHPAAGRHGAADGRDPAGGHRRLPPAAALGAARGRLPDDPGGDALPGREPRRGHLVDHRAARAPVRPDAGLEADVVDQLRRRVGGHAAVRPRGLARYRRAGGAGGDQRGRATCCRPTCPRRRSTAR